MNPKEFNWSEDQQVTVTNPTDQPYRFKVHNKDYQLGAHKSAKMPGYIAWVYVYGLASQLAQADDVFARWNEEELRQEYFAKVVKNVEQIVNEIEEEPEDFAGATFDEEDLPDTPEDEFTDDAADETTTSQASTPDTSKVQPMTAKGVKKSPSRP
jgi:hypothetical protein